MLSKRACDRPLHEGLVQRYLKPPRNPPVLLPPFRQVPQLCTRSCCPADLVSLLCHWLRAAIYSITAILHPLPSSTSHHAFHQIVHRPPSTVKPGPVLPSHFGFDRLSPAPRLAPQVRIACAYFRLPASPAVATSAVIDARFVPGRESASQLLGTSAVCFPAHLVH